MQTSPPWEITCVLTNIFYKCFTPHQTKTHSREHLINLKGSVTSDVVDSNIRNVKDIKSSVTNQDIQKGEGRREKKREENKRTNHAEKNKLLNLHII